MITENLNINECKDVRLEDENYKFHLRVAAVITKNDKYLIQQIDGYNYYVLPGGHVHLGENGINAIEREVKEEVGCETKEAKIFCLHENLFIKNGKKEHWIELYFKIIAKEELPHNNWNQNENDNGQEKSLKFKWVTKEELKEIDLKPKAIKELLIDNKINELTYLIDDETNLK